jgi:hypothetical protein
MKKMKVLVSVVVVISVLLTMAGAVFAQPQKFIPTYEVKYQSMSPGYYSSSLINWNTSVKVGNKYFNVGDIKTTYNNDVHIVVKGIEKIKVHKKYNKYNKYYGEYNGQLHQGNNYITVYVKKNNYGPSVKWKVKIYCSKKVYKPTYKPTFRPSIVPTAQSTNSPS